ncbi:MAG: hypothetical protein ACRYG8_23340 [Janthinobacterium lividum]
MVRLGLLLVMMLAAAGWRPVDPVDIARVMGLRPPSSQAVAERAAEEFVRQRLDYPSNTELTFRPAVRGYLGKAGDPDDAYAAIWMCGTVRVGPTVNTAAWMVAFDRKQPDLVHDGDIGFGRRQRFTGASCTEIYRDGILVFGR